MAIINITLPTIDNEVSITIYEDTTDLYFDFSLENLFIDRVGDDLLIQVEGETPNSIISVNLEGFYTIYSSEYMPNFKFGDEFYEGESFFAGLDPKLMPAAGSETSIVTGGGRYYDFENPQLADGLTDPNDNNGEGFFGSSSYSFNLFTRDEADIIIPDILFSLNDLEDSFVVQFRDRFTQKNEMRTGSVDGDSDGYEQVVYDFKQAIVDNVSLSPSVGYSATVHNFDLQILNSDTGLTSAGKDIILVEHNGIIYGVHDLDSFNQGIDNDNDGIEDALVFTIEMSAAGEIISTLYKSIDHEHGGTSDDSLSLPNGLIVATSTLRIETLQGVIIDSEITLDFGGNVEFQDDAPQIEQISHSFVDITDGYTYQELKDARDDDGNNVFNNSDLNNNQEATLDDAGTAPQKDTASITLGQFIEDNAEKLWNYDFGGDDQGTIEDVDDQPNKGANESEQLEFDYALELLKANSGLKSGGEDITLVYVNGKIFGITATHDISNPIFSISTNSNGKIELELFEPLDHLQATSSNYSADVIEFPAGLVALKATLTVIDSDGDSVQNSLSFDLENRFQFTDDGPSVTPNALVIAQLQDGTSNANGDIGTIDFGEDGGSFAWDINQPALRLLNNIGTYENVSWSVSNNGLTLTGKVTGIANAIVLSMNPSTGVYTTNLNTALEHINSDIASFDFNYTLTDSDNDIFTGKAKVEITDDSPSVTPDTLVTAQVHDGTANANGDIGTIDFGEDGGSFAWDINQPALRLLNNIGTYENVSWSVSNNGLTLTGKVTGIANAIVLSMNPSTGVYTANLNTALEHGSDNTASFEFKYTLTDNDNDIFTGKAKVEITDDSPSVGTISYTNDNQLDESDLQNSATSVVKGSVAIDMGDDGLGSFKWTTTPTSMATKDGAVTWTPDTNNPYLLVGTVGNTEVMRIEMSVPVNGQAQFTVTLSEAVKHSAQGADILDNLDFGFTFTDKDGDETNGSVSVEVKDSVPKAVDDTVADSLRGGESASGNLLANDTLNADGITLDINLTGWTKSVGNGTITLTKDGHKLVVDTEGANIGDYTFTANSTISADGNFDFSYTLTDSDNDTSSAKLSLEVQEDVNLLYDSDMAEDIVNITVLLNVDGPSAATGGRVDSEQIALLENLFEQAKELEANGKTVNFCLIEYNAQSRVLFTGTDQLAFDNVIEYIDNHIFTLDDDNLSSALILAEAYYRDLPADSTGTPLGKSITIVLDGGYNSGYPALSTSSVFSSYNRVPSLITLTLDGEKVYAMLTEFHNLRLDNPDSSYVDPSGEKYIYKILGTNDKISYSVYSTSSTTKTWWEHEKIGKNPDFTADEVASIQPFDFPDGTYDSVTGIIEFTIEGETFRIVPGDILYDSGTYHDTIWEFEVKDSKGNWVEPPVKITIDDDATLGGSISNPHTYDFFRVSAVKDDVLSHELSLELSKKLNELLGENSELHHVDFSGKENNSDYLSGEIKYVSSDIDQSIDISESILHKTKEISELLAEVFENKDIIDTIKESSASKLNELADKIDGLDVTAIQDSYIGSDIADIIFGFDEKSNIFGKGGDDFIFGSGGVDTIYGGAGNDYIHGGLDGDRIYGEDGDDTISGGGGDDAIYGGIGNDHISGEAGVDVIYAGDGDDIIYGGTANDVIYGDGGDDIIYGGKHSDTMAGDSVADNGSVNGKIGKDTFVWRESDFSDNAKDVILDFDEGDKLDLTAFKQAGYKFSVTGSDSNNKDVTIEVTNTGSETQDITLQNVNFTAEELKDLQDALDNNGLFTL